MSDVSSSRTRSPGSGTAYRKVGASVTFWSQRMNTTSRSSTSGAATGAGKTMP